MNDLKKKITRYVSAAGALLAVAPLANASAIQGRIVGDDGNTVLNHDEDVVFIDINNDGEYDFVGVMYTTSDTSLGNTYTYKIAMFGSYGSGTLSSVDMDGSGPPFIHKFDINDPIGPLQYPSSFGYISIYSTGGGPHAPAVPPALNDPFLTDGMGFMGIVLGDGSGGENYGWVQIDVNDGDVSFIDCAIERNVNTPIAAGSAVPILPIASALGLGLIGTFAALRRRNKKQQ